MARQRSSTDPFSAALRDRTADDYLRDVEASGWLTGSSAKRVKEVKAAVRELFAAGNDARRYAMDALSVVTVEATEFAASWQELFEALGYATEGVFAATRVEEKDGLLRFTWNRKRHEVAVTSDAVNDTDVFWAINRALAASKESRRLAVVPRGTVQDGLVHLAFVRPKAFAKAIELGVLPGSESENAFFPVPAKPQGAPRVSAAAPSTWFVTRETFARMNVKGPPEPTYALGGSESAFVQLVTPLGTAMPAPRAVGKHAGFGTVLQVALTGDRLTVEQWAGTMRMHRYELAPVLLTGPEMKEAHDAFGQLFQASQRGNLDALYTYPTGANACLGARVVDLLAVIEGVAQPTTCETVSWSGGLAASRRDALPRRSLATLEGADWDAWLALAHPWQVGAEDLPVLEASLARRKLPFRSRLLAANVLGRCAPKGLAERAAERIATAKDEEEVALWAFVARHLRSRKLETVMKERLVSATTPIAVVALACTKPAWSGAGEGVYKPMYGKDPVARKLAYARYSVSDKAGLSSCAELLAQSLEDEKDPAARKVLKAAVASMRHAARAATAARESGTSSLRSR